MQSLRLLNFGIHKSIQSQLLSDVFKWKLVHDNSVRYMAGHSKWSNIVHQKTAMDSQRANTQNRLRHAIRTAITEGDGVDDPKLNLKLKRIIQTAKNKGMPVASIENTIKNFKKSQDKAKNYIVKYYGSSGVYIIIEVFTENLSQTKIDILAIVKRCRLKEAKGSTCQLFDEKGVFIISKQGMSYEQAMDTAIEIGAEDVFEEEKHFVFMCAHHDFSKVLDGLESHEIAVEYADKEFLPIKPVMLPEDTLHRVEKATQKLENLTEVVKIHTNISYG